ncbi:MAG: HD domain-containing protein [Candidatus Glassbacteria bacterium]|nr:HD domain-containing protein [Candidatus Glassbacteria bacterium]
MRDYDRVVERLKAEIEQRFGGKALARHTHSVAEFAREIAGSVDGGDERLQRKTYVAGLAHDLYRKFTEQKLRELIRRDNVPIDDDAWRFGGGLLHAPPAAHFLHAGLGVSDEAVICAVYYHTTSRAGASLLDRVLFCADYLDPSREVRNCDPDVAELSRRVLTDLDGVYREVLSRKLAHTISRGRPLHPNGIAAWNEVLSFG